MLCRLLNLFSKLSLSKYYLKNIIKMLNSLNPDHARQNVGHDLGTDSLQRLSAGGQAKSQDDKRF